MQKCAASAALVLCGAIGLLMLSPRSSAADRPAPDSAEQAAVRRAAVEGIKAVAGEDPAAVEKWVTFRDADGARIVDYLIKQRCAEHELRDAIAKKFGKAGQTYAADLDPDAQSVDSKVKQIQKGSISISGDAAMVTSTDVAGPLPGEKHPSWRMKKVGDSWKLLDLHTGGEGVDPMKARKEDDERLARMREITRDVSDGGFKTLDDVDHELYKLKNASSIALGTWVPPRKPIDPKTGKRDEQGIGVRVGRPGFGSGMGAGDTPRPESARPQPPQGTDVAVAADTPEQAAVRTAAVEGLKAISGEDPSAVEKWATFGRADGARIVDFEIKLRRAEHEFRDAVARKFGKPGANYAADKTPGYDRAMDVVVQDLRKGTVAIDGDAATITYVTETARPYRELEHPTWRLKKVGSSWKLLDMHGYSNESEAKQWKENADRLARMQKMTHDVGDGAYKTLDDVDRDVYDYDHWGFKELGYHGEPRIPIDPQTGNRVEQGIGVRVGRPGFGIGMGAGDTPRPKTGAGVGAGRGEGVGSGAPLPQPKQDPGDGANKIVFVLDGSEASKPLFDALVLQVRRAVDNLDSTVSFAIVVTGGGAVKKQTDALLPATAENKRKAGLFFKDFQAGGKSDLPAAMTAAIAYKPGLIFLTACDIPKEAKLRETVRALNKDATVKIFTLAIEGNARVELELSGIAQDSGGVYHSVTAKSLEEQ